MNRVLGSVKHHLKESDLLGSSLGRNVADTLLKLALLEPLDSSQYQICRLSRNSVRSCLFFRLIHSDLYFLFHYFMDVLSIIPIFLFYLFCVFHIVSHYLFLFYMCAKVDGISNRKCMYICNYV